jgi:hypothetical protein
MPHALDPTCCPDPYIFQVSARFQWIKGQVLDQCHLLETGQRPTVDGPPLVR